MKRHQTRMFPTKRLLSGAFLSVLVAIVSSVYGAGYPYLDDAEPVLNTLPFPKPIKTMGNLGSTAQAYSKYDVVSYVAGQDATKARDARNLNPSMRLHFQISGRAYQGEIRCMGFRSTGPNTDTTTGMMFAGHWLYKKGTRLTSAVDDETDTLYVDSTAEFTGPYAYVVIYDEGTNFTNAEHARIISVGTNYLKVSRGYKSTAVAHAGRSIIAEHALGDVGNLTEANSDVWSYNHATTCPQDAGGKTAGERNAEWISRNYNVNQNGAVVSGLNPDGVLFDADSSFPGDNTDVNNDLVVDGGTLSGVNEWLAGYQRFYANVRAISGFANKSIVGGVPDAMGFAANGLSGSQMEDWPYFFKDITNPNLDYEANFSDYLTHAYYHSAPSPYTECLYKHGTALYTSEGAPYGWQEFRLALGSALLGDGYFGQKADDPWYEEYSVDPATGRADPISTPQHKHWMGKALGKFERIYDATAFESNDAVLRETDVTIGLSGNYTLCFTASTPKTEIVDFGLGYPGRNIVVPTSPKKFVFTFYNQTGNRPIRIEGGGVSVSDVYLFKGTADLLRRDFEKAVVFVNLGNESKTIVVPAGERLMRIQGNGGVLDPVNNGAVYDGNESDSFDLPAKDAAILVRLSSVPAGPPRAPRGLRVE